MNIIVVDEDEVPDKSNRQKVPLHIGARLFNLMACARDEYYQNFCVALNN